MSKKIRALVPNHAALFAANANGTLEVKEKPHVVAEAKKEASEAPKKVYYVKKNTALIMGFRNNERAGIMCREGSVDFMKKQALIDKVAEITGDKKELVAFTYSVLHNPNHTSNKGRVMMFPKRTESGRTLSKKDELVKIVPYDPVLYKEIKSKTSRKSKTENAP